MKKRIVKVKPKKEVKNAEEKCEEIFVKNEIGDNVKAYLSEKTIEKCGKRKLNNGDNLSEKKKKKLKENDLYRQPTVEELNQLRETENLFHSNLFRLQIEEILNQVKIKEKYKNMFNCWFSKFKENIFSLKETKCYELSDTKGLKKIGITIPAINTVLPENNKTTFKYLKPSNIKVIGGFNLGTCVGPNVKIDVMVQMPLKLFIKHDYENYAYLIKRSMYLSYLASNLSDELVEEKFLIGEYWMHNLKIIPNGILSKRITIIVHLCCEEGSFKLNRFHPSKNNVKPNWYYETEIKENSAPIATPNYNSCILKDLVMAETNLKAQESIVNYENLKDGIILLKIWLNQRQSEEAFDSFNGYILTMYVLYLLQEKKLNTYMSSYQILRNVWTNLIQTDWSKEGISLSSNNSQSSEDIIEYHKYYDCVFLDYTGYHNILSNISINNYLWLKNQAEIAIESLNNLTDSFQNLFLRQLPFYSLFDNFICINNTKSISKLFDKKISKENMLDLGVNKRFYLIKLITDILKKALTNRISQIYIKPDEIKQWKINESNDFEIGRIFIGFELNKDNCFNIIEKGPHPNSPEAVEFKKFWGNKSELRRFKDGSICEATVWINDESITINKKRTICKNIISYILKHKLNLSDQDWFYFGDQIDEILMFKTINNYGTGEEATLKVLHAFNELEKELTGLNDIPLTITGVQGVSSVFRYTDAFPPLPLPPLKITTHFSNSQLVDNCVIFKNKNESDIKINKVPKYHQATEIIIKLSTSGKWPNDIDAFRKTKSAFYLQIAQSLRKQYKLITKANYDWIDILKNGYIFRLKIANEKEIGLLKQIKGNDGVLKYIDNVESLKLEKQLFHLPKLCGALYGLHCQEPSYGPTCCLIKRWLSSQLIDYHHIPEIVIELIIAHIFISTTSYKPSQIPQINFIRVLQFFSKQSWITEPIIVNFNNEISKEKLIEINNNFQLIRDKLAPMFIITPYDTDKSIWSKEKPTKIMLHRIVALSNEALKIINFQIFSYSLHSNLDLKSIFKPPTSNYHIIIHLNNQFNPKLYQFHQINTDIKDLSSIFDKKNTEKFIPIVNFNPIENYLNELRKSYSEFALFFYDSYGGSVIGVLFNPNALQNKDFKVNNINCRSLTENGNLVLNISAIIQDFSIIGGGLVKEIIIQSKTIL